MKKEEVIKIFNAFKNGSYLIDKKGYEKQLSKLDIGKEKDIDKALLSLFIKASFFFKELAEKSINLSMSEKDKLFTQAMKSNPIFAHPYELIRKLDYKDNIFIISNEVLEKLIRIPLPESLKFSELKHLFELPALFIFEKRILVFDHQTYQESLPYKTVLFNLELQIKHYPELRFIPDSFDEYISIYEKTNKINTSYKDYYHAVFILMLLINQKNFQKISIEYNQKITQWEKELEKNYDAKKEKALSKEKSYKFVDLSLSFDKSFSSSNNEKDVTGTKEPHWRSAHWHTYWTGKRDSNERKKILHFLPETWIGNPLEITENTNKFKIVK